MTANLFLDDRNFEQHNLEPRDQDSQYAPTLGYYGRGQALSCGFTPSTDYLSEHNIEALS
jgi:hypothetical protein